ncbi:serine/threonine protein kinase [Aetokthonos hydrillicola Thurmond2011]|jgi:serine/threonine-protein kinase|uniref:non-specific serine/threonine protein kinase n=1 Tax=Aetokthonos hydrillicola Thurmond2011 TaxID=2712845 RepID=A0AAP5I5P2_9CYAN|nr:serine/threonine-protein kinase [Aetokthonos hydrillicola]MBO3460039.1 serine/threonine protein kinase [Aetokthonos hydrillicola CCALA 1050]MBW4584636.1 serine/threonine protein kinase [Aetokthonos hydrillicola CCALA 1050]MDR9895180.1 serine/threonine protein kinase [Aetokthonos hydrillicola Thurmond2011]
MQVYCTRQHVNHESNRFCSQCGEALPLSPGLVVENRYEVVRLLGQGGFGRTYLALDIKRSQQKCVLKEFAPQIQQQQELQKAKELFEREANVLKRLQHPQIPQFHSWLQVKLGKKDFFFLVQDYVEGDNYLQLLENRKDKRQGFSEQEVTKLLQNILPVLSYIHSLDVVHRDISPDNLILRSSDNLPVLIDFGGVKQLPASKGFWFTQLTENRTLLGKKGYAPEEQLRLGQAFHSSDLYALAVTALVLLTGKEPEHLYDSYHGTWRWGKKIKVSSRLEAVLKKMLAYKPDDRYQQADEVLKALGSSTPTKPINSQLTKIKTMVLAPGKQRANAVTSQVQSKTQAIVKSTRFPIWLRPFAFGLIGTSVVVLSFVGSWLLVTTAIQTVSSISLPKFSLPGISLPKIPDQSNSPKSDKPTQNKEIDPNTLLSRRQQLEIPEGFLNHIVNDTFYTKHPDLRGRSLTAKSEDTALRKEWFGVADEVLNKLEQANLSTASRRKLGSYSGRDYTNWVQQAQAGRLGNYTITQLQNDTNEKFDKLFPGQRHGNGNLNKQTFAQIWYAIAADQVQSKK